MNKSALILAKTRVANGEDITKVCKSLGLREKDLEEYIEQTNKNDLDVSSELLIKRIKYLAATAEEAKEVLLLAQAIKTIKESFDGENIDIEASNLEGFIKKLKL